MISGKTTLIAHVGYPTESFKAPLIYNPWFDSKGIDAVVVPMGVKAEDYAAFFGTLFRLSNIRGALVTMPHKVTTVALLDESSTAVKVAGAEPSFNRSDLYRSTDAVVMSMAFVPPNTASRRGSRVVLRSPRLFRPLFV